VLALADGVAAAAPDELEVEVELLDVEDGEVVVVVASSPPLLADVVEVADDTAALAAVEVELDAAVWATAR
jgi:hypothetical protein